RFCSQNIFLGCKANGENYKREWLLYSPSVGSVYCFVCKLFSPKSFNSRFATDGFSDWSNSNMIHKHENSSIHRDCMLSYLNRRHNFGFTHEFETQIDEEHQYWKAILRRIVAVIITIAERGLSFQGRNEVFGLISDKVRTAIFSEISVARYFSLSVDSTPDLSHTDQLSIVLRYVSPTDGRPVERFITFTSLKSHTGEEIADQVLHYLCEVCKVDFSKCSAVDGCPEAVDFFSSVRLLCTFFASSAHRWAVLKTYLGNDRLLKCLSDSRWEAHAVATSAILESYPQILDALDDIAEDQTQKGDTRREAANIANRMQTLEYVFMLVMWNHILQHFHWTSQALQDSEVNLQTCTDLYRSLTGYLHNLREDFEKFEKTTKQILPHSNYQAVDHRRSVRKKRVDGGGAPEVSLSARDEFRVTTYYAIVDILESCMKRRAEVYAVLADRFSFLNNVDIPDEECMKASQKLVQAYPDDLNTNLYGEVRQFHSYMRTKFTDSGMYDSIIEDKIQCVFPNVEIALRIFLTLMITNCTTERSFSSLKRLKNPQHTAVIQERPDALSLLCMEVDIVRQLNYDEIIEEFVQSK
uniref:TTF-type domain-containing protein n=1 Tax=Loxodonta africana TaxID=9785 RepID=G3TY18_LOXAF